jgi:hypothetical protein
MGQDLNTIANVYTAVAKEYADWQPDLRFRGKSMTYPWQYDETIQVGTDYSDQNAVRDYDENSSEMLIQRLLI